MRRMHGGCMQLETGRAEKRNTVFNKYMMTTWDQVSAHALHRGKRRAPHIAPATLYDYTAILYVSIITNYWKRARLHRGFPFASDFLHFCRRSFCTEPSEWFCHGERAYCKLFFYRINSLFPFTYFMVVFVLFNFLFICSRCRCCLLVGCFFFLLRPVSVLFSLLLSPNRIKIRSLFRIA